MSRQPEPALCPRCQRREAGPLTPAEWSRMAVEPTEAPAPRHPLIAAAEAERDAARAVFDERDAVYRALLQRSYVASVRGLGTMASRHALEAAATDAAAERDVAHRRVVRANEAIRLATLALQTQEVAAAT